jgi:hypothetical protein
VTRDELITLLQQRRNNDVIVYVPVDSDDGGSYTFQVEGVDYDEVNDCIVLDAEALTPAQVTFAEAEDRRGFQVLVDNEPVGQPVTYDDFGWAGIDLAKALVVALAQVLDAEVAK